MYSSIQVFKFISLQFNKMILPIIIIINNVKARDPVGSKNSIFEIYRDCEVPLKMKG